MPSKNPDIIKKHRNNWYQRNKQLQISRQMERRNELKQKLWDYKKTLFCEDCGMSFEDKPECCDFHHVDPLIKEENVTTRIYSSWDACMRELKKCVPLCANCHRTRHKTRV